MAKKDEWDDVSDIGRIDFNGCSRIDSGGIDITIAEAWNDEPYDPRDRGFVLVDCHGGPMGIGYRLTAAKAIALGNLLLDAAERIKRGERAIVSDWGLHGKGYNVVAEEHDGSERVVFSEATRDEAEKFIKSIPQYMKPRIVPIE